MKRKCVLIILDGWGIPKNRELSAIDRASTPFINSLYRRFPHSKLQASGPAIGLPEGQMGNSEVGHYSIGAGRILKQSLVRINEAIADRSFYRNEVILRAFDFAKRNNVPVHLIGLASSGGVHSHINHMLALCSMASELDIKELYLHAFTDGRDTHPSCARDSLEVIENHMHETTGSIATLIGRYYAMDRDNRWDRTAVAYNALLNDDGEGFTTWQEALAALYGRGLTDEFFVPTRILNRRTGTPSIIKPQDVVIAFNFRADRMRQLTYAITQHDAIKEGFSVLPVHYVSLTDYDKSFSNIHVAFEELPVHDTLGDVIAQSDLAQVRIAETEKYPHVTYFFSGGREELVPRETRILCPSPKVSTYDLLPEMSAYEITNKTLWSLSKEDFDFVCVNLANADMVGHTGIFSATVRACEVVDSCLEQIIPSAIKNDYDIMIVADHGNADMMITENGEPHTAHTYNLVPCILVSENKNYKLLRDGSLIDVAPTILEIMGISKPRSMTGSSLIR